MRLGSLGTLSDANCRQVGWSSSLVGAHLSDGVVPEGHSPHKRKQNHGNHDALEPHVRLQHRAHAPVVGYVRVLNSEARGVNSGAREVNSGARGVNSGAQGVDSGAKGVDSAKEPKSQSQTVTI
eukprot:8760823-Pyramimonas_sp.AAC.1